MRMSGGVFGEYSAPKSHRARSETFRAKSTALSSSTRATATEIDFKKELINVWPLFYRSGDYTSVMWPVIDHDPYGMAVRPFYNHEGDEYSILFPLCAWNPVAGDGWFLTSWWNFKPKRTSFTILPFAHYTRTANEGDLWVTPLFRRTWSPRPLTRANRSRGFRTMALLAYYGETERKDAGGNDWIFESGDKWTEIRQELQYRFDGTDKPLPRDRAALTRFQDAAYAALPTVTRREWGFFPLLSVAHEPGKSQEKGPLRLFRRDARETGTEWDLLWKIGASYESGRVDLSRGIPWSNRSAHRTIKLPPLLSWFRHERHYHPDAHAKLDALRRLKNRSNPYDSVSFEERLPALRDDLKIIDPSLEFPRTVVGRRTLGLYVSDLARGLDYPSVDVYEGGVLPLFNYEFSDAETSWNSPILLTGRSVRGGGESSFWSVPLLTYVSRSPTKDVTTFAGPIGWYAKNTRGTRADKRVFGRDVQWAPEREMVAFEDDYALLGLYYHGRDSFQIVREGASLDDVEFVRTSLLRHAGIVDGHRRWRERLDTTRRQLAERKTPTRLDELRKAVAEEEARLEGERFDAEAARYATVTQEVRRLCAKLGFALPAVLPESKEAMATLAEKFVAAHTELRSIEDYGNGLFYRREVRSNGDRTWHWLHGLAGGERRGAREEMHVLHFIYRSRRDGNKSEKTIFPFVSIQKDGDDARWSFLWRFFAYERKDGKCRGSFLFIPFGD